MTTTTANLFPQDHTVTSFLQTIDTLTGQCLILAEFPYRIEAPNWTQDGKKLIYNSGGHIFTFDLSSRMSQMLDTGFATRCNNDHVLSPDGGQLAVSHHSEQDGHSRIYTLSLQGGQPKQITPNGPSYLHGWSPDGSTLAYCAARNGQYDIYTIGADGGEETQLTDLPGLDDGPEYSPCGQYIWFNSTRSGLMQVWRMQSDGQQPQQMTFDQANSWFPHVSPDGEQVAYISYRKGDVAPGEHPPNKQVELRLMPAQGGEFRTLVSLFGGQGTINVNSWAPDSRTLAFVSYRLKG